MKYYNYIFIVFFCFSSLILYHWKQNKNLWIETLVKKSIIEWKMSSMVVVIKEDNKYIIKIFDLQTKKFINVEEFTIESIFLDNQNIEKKIQKLHQKNSVIYVIHTKIPINFLFDYMKEKNIEIKTPFILFNQQDNKAIVHNYFFLKSKEINEFTMLNIVNLNEIINKKNFLNKDFNNRFLLGFNDLYNINILLQKYEELENEHEHFSLSDKDM
jgi:hypothetical protein